MSHTGLSHIESLIISVKFVVEIWINCGMAPP